MAAPLTVTRRIVRITVLGVCLVVGGDCRDAGAQTTVRVDAAESRGLAKACGRTGRWADCFAAVRGRLARVADLILAELQAAPAPGITSVDSRPSTRVVWDGTFAHPNAPGFYLLRSYVPPAPDTSADVCGQLPEPLRADRQMLLKLVCSAQRELLAEGPGRWPDEMAELENVRQRLTACLPAAPAPAADPCAGP